MVRRRTQRQKGGANVKNETYMNALKRNYVFFYHKLKGEEPPLEKRFIEPEQEKEVKRILLNAKRRGMEEDDIVRNIFKAEPVKFQQELSNWEEHKPTGFLNQGTQYERRAFPIAKSLDRFIGTIQASPKEVKYRSDFMVSICSGNNFDKPVVSLSDGYCISVLTPPLKEKYEEKKEQTIPSLILLLSQTSFHPV